MIKRKRKVMTQPLSNLESMEKLHIKYRGRLKDTLNKIDSLQTLLQKDQPSKELIAELKTLAHGMAGTGGTFGYPEITSCGRKLDQYILHGGMDVSVMSDLLNHLYTACASALETGEDKRKSLIGTQKAAQKECSPFILVVDDDQEIAEFLKVHFSARGLDIEVAQDGVIAIEMLSTLKPDLVILDIMMPKINGHQVLEFMKEHDKLKNVPVIMLTSHQENTNIIKALSNGAIDYIVKPFRAAQLINKAEDLLAASRKTILIIENDPLVVEFISYIYTDRGYHVVTASNGMEGWKIIKQDTPDLIVLDWLLPKMDAVDVLKNLHGNEQTKNIPVIVLADKNEDATAYPGISQFITKPFIPRDLLKRSLALLGGVVTD